MTNTTSEPAMTPAEMLEDYYATQAELDEQGRTGKPAPCCPNCVKCMLEGLRHN